MTNGARKNGTTMPTAMAIQFIITLNANRLVLAIGIYTRKLHDTTASLPPFPAVPETRYLLSDYHFGAKIVPFPPHQDEISSEDVEPLAEPGILHPAHDSNPQEEFVTTGTIDNAIMMPSERVAT